MYVLYAMSLAEWRKRVCSLLAQWMFVTFKGIYTYKNRLLIRFPCMLVSLVYISQTHTYTHILKLHIWKKRTVHNRKKKFIFYNHRTLIIQFHFSGSMIRVFQTLIESKAVNMNVETQRVYGSKSFANAKTSQQQQQQQQNNRETLFEEFRFWAKSPNRCVTCGNANKTTKILWNDQACAHLFIWKWSHFVSKLNKIIAASSLSNNRSSSIAISSNEAA